MQELQPIFIGGCDRSGTTLLGALLGGSPEAVTTPESQFLSELYPGTPERLTSRLVEMIIERLSRHWRLMIWGIPNIKYRLKSVVNKKNCTYSDIITAIVRLYAAETGKHEAKTWIDHTPSNLLYAHRLLEMFPSAKFIHIVRDGRGVAESFLKLPWGPNTTYSAADFWVSKVGIGVTAEMWLQDKKIIRVYYEDLLKYPEITLKKVCNFLNIEYTPNMAEGGCFCVPRYTRRQHSLIGMRPTAEKIDSWKVFLTRREIELFEARSGDVLTYMGYELVFNGNARGPKRIELYQLTAKDWLLKRVNTMRSRLRVLLVRMGVL